MKTKCLPPHLLFAKIVTLHNKTMTKECSYANKYNTHKIQYKYNTIQYSICSISLLLNERLNVENETYIRIAEKEESAVKANGRRFDGRRRVVGSKECEASPGSRMVTGSKECEGSPGSRMVADSKEGEGSPVQRNAKRHREVEWSLVRRNAKGHR